MDKAQDLQDLKDFLVLQSDSVQENCVIVTPEQMGVKYALHIDKNVPEALVPRMPRSAMITENDSCPRVTVACTLLGCYIGYFRTEADVTKGSFQRPEIKDQFRGGYEISKIPFDHALKPNKKMVPDGERFEELWLVSYNEEHTEYTPERVGKIFVSELKYIPASGRAPQLEPTFYIENNDPEGMWLDKENKLEVGHYKLTVRWPSIFVRSIFKNEFYELTKIEESEFNAQKQKCADLLEYQQPKYMGW